ncbi:MAG: glycosyltransferase [Rhodobacterales bacterium]|nr:glycosyltransferase [Rhodobacterales bacterium]
MATFNGAAHLGEQLDSLARQTHPAWSLWVSDDGSTDATRAILQDFAARHPAHPLTLVEGPRTGRASDNFLTALCHPDLPAAHVALCDQDDVWLRGKLARALRRLGDDPAPAIYAAESVLTDADLRPHRISAEPHARPGFASALVQNLFGGHSLVLNPAALALVRAAGAPAGLPFHDWWIYLLVAGAGGRLVLDPAPMVLYRQHGGNHIGALGGLGGALRKVRAVLGPGHARWVRANLAALRAVAPLLTPEARALLDRLDGPPQRGPDRARLLRDLGVTRPSAAGAAAVTLAALLGRI